MKQKSIPFMALAALSCVLSCSKVPQDWAWLGFARPEGVNPIISPTSGSVFYCPMTKGPVKWECSDTFNPAATVAGDSIVVLYRSEDSLAQGIGRRTSRIGYASSADGLHYTRRGAPVMYPGGDDQVEFEVPGGCEDPRVCMTKDGTYVMMYTQWNRKVARLSVATSWDLVHWEKHGPAFWNAHDGKFRDLFCKSGSIVTVTSLAMPIAAGRLCSPPVILRYCWTVSTNRSSIQRLILRKAANTRTGPFSWKVWSRSRVSGISSMAVPTR